MEFSRTAPLSKVQAKLSSHEPARASALLLGPGPFPRVGRSVVESHLLTLPGQRQQRGLLLQDLTFALFIQVF